MARGLPDYGVRAAKSTVGGLADLGELARRLGAIPSIDGLGDVMWFDGFEDGLEKWYTETSGTGASVEWTAAKGRNGGFSCLLKGGSSAYYYASIFHRQAIPVLSSIGVEFSFHVETFTDNLLLQVVLYDGTDMHVYAIRWRDTDDDLQYLNSADVWTTFATSVSVKALLTLFHTAKLVIDPVNKEYRYFILDATTYLLTDIAAPILAYVESPYLELSIKNTSRSGNNDEIYIDDIILTQNEP